MPYYFLSEEAADLLKADLGKQIEDLEKQIWMKKAIWNDLDNKSSTIPEQIETD